MKKRLILILAAVLLLSSCFQSRKIGCDVRGRKPDYKYTPRLQGSERWNYKKYMGPKRRVR